MDWGVQEEEAFRRLKIAMITAPILQCLDFDREFTMTTGTSEVSVGAIFAVRLRWRVATGLL